MELIVLLDLFCSFSPLKIDFYSLAYRWFLGVGTTFDIFQNILFPYGLNTHIGHLGYDVLDLVSFVVFGDLRDNWIEISSNKDFLGPTPPYVYIRDPEHGPRDGHHRISVAQYLFRYAEGRKSGARLFGGHFIGRLAAHFGLVSDAGLRERQQVTVAGAPKAAEDAPIDVEGDLAILTPVQVAQPPLAARTISQRLARLEEDVHRIQIGLGELPDSQRLLQIHHVGSRRVGKGCSGVETPLFVNMLQVREEDAEEEVQQVLDKYSALVHRVEGLESANTAQQLEILKHKARVKKLERLNNVKSSKLRRLKKVGTSQRIKSSEDEENVFNQGRISVDIHEGIELVIPAAEPVVSAVCNPISAAKPKVLKAIPAAPTVSTRKRKGVVIRDPEEELHDDTPTETQFAKDKGKGIFIEDPKPMKKKDQIAMDAEYARKLQEEEESLAQAKDAKATACLKNTEGFKMSFFKGKTYDQIRPIFQARFDANMIFLLKLKEEMEKEEEEIIKSINETPAQKAAKRRRLHEQAKEAEDLKKQLEVVADEDDDVFVEATPIGTKVPVVNYEIVMINNKARSYAVDFQPPNTLIVAI
nr:hypothetical protein [Tanacetum cinerariifolium]